MFIWRLLSLILLKYNFITSPNVVTLSCSVANPFLFKENPMKIIISRCFKIFYSDSGSNLSYRTPIYILFKVTDL